MSALFPFGFPGPTALYLSLYVATLVLHVLLMGYVLAGSAVMALQAGLDMARRTPRADGQVQAVLRDWLPFFLGAAITAGVAPLLFLQVLYKEGFYTANLLLMHRFMALLPALIIGFYLLYVQKTAWLRSAPSAVRLAVSLGAFAMFVFVAGAWTENHLLALRGQAGWVSFYASKQLFYSDPAFWPRLGMWLAGALPVMATIVATQIAWLRRRGIEPSAAAHAAGQDPAVAGNIGSEASRLATLAMAGLVVAGICALSYPQQAENAAVLWSPLCRAYVFGGSVGVMLQSAGWWHMRRTAQIGTGLLWLLWTGMISIVVGVAVVREALRLASLDVTALYAQHDSAAQQGGSIAFMIFMLLNTAGVGWCMRQVARAAANPSERKEVEIR